jgi:hypothetical protein
VGLKVGTYPTLAAGTPIADFAGRNSENDPIEIRSPDEGSPTGSWEKMVKWAKNSCQATNPLLYCPHGKEHKDRRPAVMSTRRQGFVVPVAIFRRSTEKQALSDFLSSLG